MASDMVIQWGAAQREQDDRALDAWLQERGKAAADAGPIAAPSPTAAPAKPKSTNPIAAGASAAWDTWQHGATNFLKGTARSLNPFRGTEDGFQSIPVGQQVLGVVQMLSALPAGLGATVQQAIGNYAPEKGKEIAIPGGRTGPGQPPSPAAYIRTIMGVPQLLFDPETRKQDPRLTEQMLAEPIRYDELANMVAQLAMMPAMNKALGMGRKPGAAGAPEVATAPVGPEAPPPATLRAADPSVTRMGQAAPAAPSAEVTITVPRTLEELQSAMLGGRTLAEIKAGPAPAAPRSPAVQTMADLQQKMAAQVRPMTPEEIAAEVRASLETIREETKTGFDQPARPRSAEGAPEPATPEGPLASAAEVATEKTGGPLKSPTDLKSAYDLAVEKVDAQLRADPEFAAEMQSRSGEVLAGGLPAGMFNVGIVARMAVGAVLGCGTADTPEACVYRGLIGAGVGAVASKSLAKKLAGSIKGEAPTLAEAAPRANSGRVLADEPYQPNYSRIAADADVIRTMKTIHRSVADKITEAMKRPTSHDETTKAAWDLIQQGKVTPETLLRGDPVAVDDLPAFGKAARDLSVGAATEVVDLAKKVAAGETLTHGQLRAAVSLSGALAIRARSLQTRGGQMVEAFKIKAEAPGTGMGDRSAPGRMADLADAIAPGMTDAELAASILADSRAARVGKQTTFMAALPGALLESMYGSMFSGVSIVKNVLGNTVMQPAAMGARAIGARVPGWRDPSRVAVGEASAMADAWWSESIRQMGLLRSWKAWQEQAAGPGKMGEVRHNYRAIDTLADTLEGTSLEGSILQKAIRGWGSVIRKPLEVMNASDASATAIANRMELAAQARRQAALEGLARNSPEHTARIAEIEENPALLTGRAWNDVREFALEQTFMKDLEGRLGGALQAGPTNEWANLVYRATIAPVFRTAVRVMEGSLDYSGNPITQAMSARWRADMLAGGARGQTAVGKWAMGATALGTFMYMALNDWVTGSAPSDPKKRALWGKPEESWWDPVSGTYRSYKGLDPLSKWVRNAADLAQLSRDLPENDFLHLMAQHTLITVNNLDSENWWLGVSDVIKLFTERHGRDEQVEAAMDLVRKRLALWSPAFLNEVRKGTDPGQRVTRPSGAIEDPLEREWDALVGKYKTRTPFFSDQKNEQGRDLYPLARDPMTGEHEVYGQFPFAIWPSIPDKRTPARNEISRLQPQGVGRVPDHIGTPRDAGGGIGMEPAKAGQVSSGIKLGRGEQDRWEELKTQVVKDPNGRLLKDAMEHLITTSQYTGTKDRPTSDFRKRELLSHTWQEFEEAAQKILLRERPDLMAAYLKARVQPAIQRQSPVDQPGMQQRAQDAIRQAVPRGAAPGRLNQ